MTEHAPRSGDVDMIRAGEARISDEEQTELAGRRQRRHAAAAFSDGVLSAGAPTGVGRLADVIGPEAADEFFSELEATRRYLYSEAVSRWGSQGSSLHRVRAGAAPKDSD